MNFQYEQVLQLLVDHMLPFFRVAAFIMIAPIFSTGFIPTRIRSALAVLLSIAIIPQLDSIDPGYDPISFGMLLLIVEQIIIGVVLGFVMQLIFAAAVAGGHIVGMQMGLGFAQMQDPSTGINVPVISQFYNLMAVLLFLSLNGHLVLIEILVSSFSLMPIGAGIYAPATFEALVKAGALIFSDAIVIALPAVISLLMINITMGVITRATPQMNIFAVGFAITIISGFVVILISFSSSLIQIRHLFTEGFGMMNGVLGV